MLEIIKDLIGNFIYDFNYIIEALSDNSNLQLCALAIFMYFLPMALYLRKLKNKGTEEEKLEKTAGILIVIGAIYVGVVAFIYYHYGL